MTTKAEKFNKEQIQQGRDQVQPGDTIKVYQKIRVTSGKDKDKNKEKIQIFEGLVLARKHGKGINSTITVRKIIGGIGVEKIFPVHSPIIDKIEIVKRGKVKRAKLYYLRTAKGRKARLKRKDFTQSVEPEPTPEPASPAEASGEGAAEPKEEAEPVKKPAEEPKPEEEQTPEPAKKPETTPKPEKETEQPTEQPTEPTKEKPEDK